LNEFQLREKPRLNVAGQRLEQVVLVDIVSGGVPGPPQFELGAPISILRQ
jgi:hypothetical protein